MELGLRNRVAACFALATFTLAACGGDEPGSDPSGQGAAGATGAAGPGGGGQGGAGGSSPFGPPSCDMPGPSGSAPTARADTAGTMSTDGRNVVVFGGDVATVVCGQTPTRQHVGDTWLLDAGCGTWTELPIGGPSPRARHSMVLDAARERALLFGGRFRADDSTGAYTLYADVWAFDFVARAWSEVSTSGDGPSPRSNSAVTLLGNELFVFGGNTSTSGLSFAPANDTYALDLDTNVWRSVGSGAAPPARLFHSIAAESERGRIWVHSGGDEDALLGPFLRDVWVLDVASASWFEVPATLPGDADVGRIKFGLSVGPRQSGASVLRVFGGHDDANLGNRNDVRMLDVSTVAALPPAGSLAWETMVVGDQFNAPASGQCDFPPDFTLVDLASPERREAFAFAPRADGQAFVVFGGDSDCGRLNDVWWFDAINGQWTQVTETLPGLTCPRQGSPETCTSLCG